MEAPIRLFVDSSAESFRAEQIMKSSKVPYRIVRSIGPGIPSAQFGNDSFRGLTGINFLARVFRRFRTEGYFKKFAHVNVVWVSKGERSAASLRKR